MRFIMLTILGSAVVLAGCSEVAAREAARRQAAARATGAPKIASIQIWRPGRAPTPGPLNFRPLSAVIPGASIQLSNGVRVALADWRSVSISSTQDGSCTSTLVGPRTLLTAAHCVDAGRAPGQPSQELAGSIAIGGDDFAITCEMHGRYKAIPLDPAGGVRGTRDFALCELDRPVDPQNAMPETIDMATAPAAGMAVLLTGYGCTDIRITPAGKLTYTRGDGNLRMGDELLATINETVPSERSGIWASTKAQGGEPTLCPGDSGGPVITGANLRNQVVSRRVVGVNSAVGWRRSGAGWELDSYLAPLGTPDFRTFLEGYVRARPGTIVCGYNKLAGQGGCRA